MTRAEMTIEREHERLLRLGMMCGTRTPTPEQERIAREIAEEHVAAISMQQWKEKHDDPND